MRIRLQKCGLAGVETSCEKNGSPTFVAALLSFVEIVNWRKFNRLYLSLISKRIAVVLITVIETGEILLRGEIRRTSRAEMKTGVNSYLALCDPGTHLLRGGTMSSRDNCTGFA
jgi:hypothetical protein